MKIETQDYGQVTVAYLQGELTEEYLDNFKEALSNQASEEKQGLVLDMSKVGFIDSKGLETMLWLRDNCFENFCQLKLSGLDVNCAKIFEITRLNEQFDCYEDLNLAVKSYT